MADVLNFLVLNWMILNNRLFMWMKMLFLMQITDKKIKITKFVFYMYVYNYKAYM